MASSREPAINAGAALGVARPDARRSSSSETGRDARRPLSAGAIGLIALVLGAGAWVAGRLDLYTSKSDLGYYLGVVGAVFMLLLLLYPLRKRLRILARAGNLQHWFRTHMFLGITGPVLILYHSTFKVGSLNAAVAFYSMLIVAGSGIIGRFIYTKIHHGLYGRQATLQERKAHLGLTGESVKSKFHFAPRVEERLKAFETYAANERTFLVLSVGRLIAVNLRMRWVYWRSMREVRGIVARGAAQRGWGPQDVRRLTGFAGRLLKEYLRELQDVAQFRSYERLFSLWHVLHVPFVIMLAFSAVVHVIAVHMY